MKKVIYSIIFGVALIISSCSDFTDIQPKGKNLLSTTGQLEMLLNNEFYMGATDEREMCGDIISAFENIPTLINRPTKTRKAIIISWDEASQDKMAELTPSDDQYSEYYSVIGKISNAILSHVDAAEGPESVKN